MALEDVKEMIVQKLHALGEELLLTVDHDTILLISRSIRNLHLTLAQLNGGRPMRVQRAPAGPVVATGRRRLPAPPRPGLTNLN